jgi:autotransporter-associated beta strand protein
MKHRTSQNYSRLTSVALSTAFLFGAVVQSSAATYTWDGGGSNDNWGTGTNWVGNAIPTFDNTADIVFYAAGALRLNTNVIGADRTIRSITFNGSQTAAVTMGLTTTSGSSRTLTFDGGGSGATFTTAVSTGTSRRFENGQMVLNDNLTINHRGTNRIELASPISGAGSLIISGSAVNTSLNFVRITAANTFTGTTTLVGNRLQLRNPGGAVAPQASLQNSPVNTTGAGLLSFDAGNSTYTLGGLVSGTSGRDLASFLDLGPTVTGGITLALNNGSGRTHTYDQVIHNISGTTAPSAMALSKIGDGTQILGGANTYTGNTTITAGVLSLSGAGSIANSPIISVASGAQFDVSAVTGGYTLGATQTLAGTGTVVGSSTIAGTLSPGNSPGTLTTGNMVWTNGGEYNWQVLDVDGAAGTGYDTISAGTLDLSGLTAGGFNINLWSLASIGPDVNGSALNFNDLSSYSWTLASTTGITGFNAANFTVNTSAANGAGGFANAFTGAFGVSTVGNNLVLTYTPVPEPAAALLGGLGSLLLLRRRRI